LPGLHQPTDSPQHHDTPDPNRLNTKVKRQPCPTARGPTAKVRPRKKAQLPSPHSNMPLTLGPGDENSETSQSPAAPPQSVGIAQAIDEAPAAELKKLVRRLWRELPQSHPLIDTALRRPLAGPSSAAPAGNLKRKASEVCENCHQVYQVDNNEKGMCVYHPRKCL
jgi:hypothetical protein